MLVLIRHALRPSAPAASLRRLATASSVCRGSIEAVGQLPRFVAGSPEFGCRPPPLRIGCVERVASAAHLRGERVQAAGSRSGELHELCDVGVELPPQQCGGEPAQLVFVDGSATMPVLPRRIVHQDANSRARWASAGVQGSRSTGRSVRARARPRPTHRRAGPVRATPRRAQHVGDALQHRAVGVAGELVAGDDVRVGGVAVAAPEHDPGRGARTARTRSR